MKRKKWLKCQQGENVYANEMQTIWTAGNWFEVQAVWFVMSILKILVDIVLKSQLHIIIFKLIFKCNSHIFILVGLTNVYMKRLLYEVY